MAHVFPAIVIFVYVILLFVVTRLTRRISMQGEGGFVGYLLADRKLPATVVAAMLAGLAVGGASTVGVAEHAYQYGFSAAWYNVAWAVGAFVMAIGAARRYRRFELTTLPELFERYYTATSRVIGVIGQLIILIVITSLQYVAGGAILSSLLPGLITFNQGMMITAIVFVAITLIGGYWAAGFTNVINVGVIYIGLVLGVIMTLSQIGGLDQLISQVPIDHPGFDLWAIGPGIIAAWFIVMITQAHSTQAVIQISFAAKDESTAVRGYFLGGLLILPVGFIAAIIGISAAVLHPGIIPTEALPRVVLDLSPLTAGVILAGLWAADISTASALLLGSTALVTNDLIGRFSSLNLNKQQAQKLCRITVLGLSVLTFALALTVQGILKMLLIALTLSTAYTVIILMTMFFPSWCRRSSATCTLLVTFMALICWLILPATWQVLPHPIYFTWVASLVTFFVVAMVDKRPIRTPNP